MKRTTTTTGGNTMTTKTFGATSTASRSWTTNHKGLRGAASAYLRAMVFAAARAGTSYTFTADDEARSMALDLIETAAARGERMSVAAARREADRLLGVKGTRGRTDDRLVTRVSSRWTMGHPERVAAMHAHKRGLISDADWDTVRARFTDTLNIRQSPTVPNAIEVVLTPKGREVYNLPAARPGDIVGFTKGNRYGGGRVIEA
jgi:hypothetical protein